MLRVERQLRFGRRPETSVERVPLEAMIKLRRVLGLAEDEMSLMSANI